MHDDNCCFDILILFLETLFKILEDEFVKLLNFNVCFVQWCSHGSINSQECKSVEIYVVTIKISMTEYHHLINHSSWFILTLQSMGG